jgi:Uma2 family endonuclease
MVDTKKFPTTEEELRELGDGPHRFPGTFDEYLDMLTRTELRIEYANDELIFMSYATYLHEALVARLLILIGQLQLSVKSITPLGSNHRIYVSDQPKSFAPDAFFVKGKAEHFRPEGKYQVSMVTNPWLIIEVLSEGTREYDLGTKLPAYQSLPSVEIILYARQDEPKITLYRRVTPNLWNSREYDLTSEALEIAGLELTVGRVYEGVGELPG